MPGRRQVDRPGGHRAAGSPPSSARPARAPSWRGTRSSCARATRWPTPWRRTGSSWASPPAGPSRSSGRSTPARSRPAPRSSSPAGNRRAGQGGRQRVPGHEDLLHQRDGRDLRGRRGRRARPGADPRRRPAHRPGLPARRARLRRRLPAQGHPGLRGPRRGARRRCARSPSCARSTRSTCAAAPAPPTWRSNWPAGTWPGRRSASWAPRSSRAPTTSATPRPWTWRRSCPAWARASPSTTRPRSTTPGASAPSSAMPQTWPRPPGARTWCCCSPSGRSSPRSRRAAWRAVARRNIIDARNVLDPAPWREAGWEYRALGVAEDTESAVWLDPSR